MPVRVRPLVPFMDKLAFLNKIQEEFGVKVDDKNTPLFNLFFYSEEQVAVIRNQGAGVGVVVSSTTYKRVAYTELIQSQNVTLESSFKDSKLVAVWLTSVPFSEIAKELVRPQRLISQNPRKRIVRRFDFEVEGLLTLLNMDSHIAAKNCWMKGQVWGHSKGVKVPTSPHILRGLEYLRHAWSIAYELEINNVAELIGWLGRILPMMGPNQIKASRLALDDYSNKPHRVV